MNKKRKLLNYSILPEHYLKRAYHCLKSGKRDEMFYAAFELRCGIEARLFEQIANEKEVSNKIKKGWRIALLEKEVERVFKNTKKIFILSIDCNDNLEPLRLIYTPVSPRLQKIGERLGDYLHFQKLAHEEDNLWWKDMKDLLIEGIQHLSVAMVGTLLSPPLYNPETLTGSFQVRVTIKDARRIDLKIKNGAIPKDKITVDEISFQEILELYTKNSDLYQKLNHGI